MDIDRNTFDQSLISNIEQILNKSEFVSFDLEMTGIKQRIHENYYDMTFNRYEKLIQSAKKFNIIQMGITFYCKSSQNQDEMIAYPYNFYIIPREILPVVFKPIIQLEMTSMEFNTNHGMDWNKWIRHGINYISKYGLDKLKKMCEEVKSDEYIQQSYNNGQGYENLLISMENQDRKPFVLQKIKEIDNLALQDQMDYENKDLKQYKIVLEGLYSFEQKIIYTYLEQKYPKFLKFSDENRGIVIMSEKGKERYIEESKYFYKIVEMISEASKFKKIPIVGHNCFMDLLFIFQSFIQFLPDDYFEFKRKIHEFFPYIYDTKQIIKLMFPDQTQKIQSTTLDNIKDYIQKNPQEFNQKVQIRLAQNYERYDFTKKENDIYSHEAGFDSYVTGWVFLKMTHNQNQAKLKKNMNVFGLYQSAFNVVMHSSESQNNQQQQQQQQQQQYTLMECDSRQNNNLVFVIRNPNENSQSYINNTMKQLRELFNNHKNKEYCRLLEQQEEQKIGDQNSNQKQQQQEEEEKKSEKLQEIDLEELTKQRFYFFVVLKSNFHEIFIELKEEFIEEKKKKFIQDLMKIYKNSFNNQQESSQIKLISLAKYIQLKNIQYKEDLREKRQNRK